MNVCFDFDVIFLSERQYASSRSGESSIRR